MSSTSFYHILEELARRVSLFETFQEADDFLKETVERLMEQAGSCLGAVFLYNPASQKLDFRVGYDKKDYWDTLRCGRGKIPKSFSLDGNEVGRAFTEGEVRRIFPGEETSSPIRSKILVPMIRGPEKIGVLLIAHEEPDFFDHLDREDLLKAASLLGGIFAEAAALLEYVPLDAEGAEEKGPHGRIKGKKASDGAAFGQALPIWADMASAARHLPLLDTPDQEAARFEKALTDSLDQLEQLQNSAAAGDAEMVSLIFTAQLYMLKDRSFIRKMRDALEAGSSAPQAVQTVVAEYADRFAAMKEVRLAEKAQDVRDLGFRMITNMGRPAEEGFSYEGKIVLSRHVYPSDLYRLAVEGVAGVVLRGAAVTAHIAILARSLSLPVLISDDGRLLSIPEGTPLLLDAEEGTLHIRPREEQVQTILDRRRFSSARQAYTLRGMTADQVPVSVMANINILKDAKEAVSQGAEGIGLYRSEFPFILKNDFLTEEQQYRIYRSIVESQPGRPVVLRTADIGGDKLLQGRSEGESNPFLGVRGIRFSLANREMFREQLRAMLRAGEGADLRILLPMVSGVEEVLLAKEEIALCREQLIRRGAPFNRNPKIGAMVELPSAAMAVGELAEETDFLSIGSNDLTMYLLAVDRTNENLSHLYRSHHPTVLRVFATIAREAGEKQGELSVCGDVAADPMMIPFFLGLGIRKLSVSPALVEGVKQRVAQFSLAEAEALAGEMLSIRRLAGMEEFMEEFRQRHPV